MFNWLFSRKRRFLVYLHFTDRKGVLLMWQAVDLLAHNAQDAMDLACAGATTPARCASYSAVSVYPMPVTNWR